MTNGVVSPRGAKTLRLLAAVPLWLWPVIFCLLAVGFDFLRRAVGVVFYIPEMLLAWPGYIFLQYRTRGMEHPVESFISSAAYSIPYYYVIMTPLFVERAAKRSSVPLLFSLIILVHIVLGLFFALLPFRLFGNPSFKY